MIVQLPDQVCGERLERLVSKQTYGLTHGKEVSDLQGDVGVVRLGFDTLVDGYAQTTTVQVGQNVVEEVVVVSLAVCSDYKFWEVELPLSIFLRTLPFR
jgi:hypothetical protein